MPPRFPKFVSVILSAAIGISSQAGAGVLKSLDQELKALIASTESYLVTVRGDGGWRNLIATGIVYDTAGHVITSSRIFEATSFNVTFKDGKSRPAHKVGVDDYMGLAVLKIEGAEFDIPEQGQTAPLQANAWVTLVGNSYETPTTINFGNYKGSTEEGLLQLSLDASPGSSGGAVLNIDGDLVGILVAREGGSHPGESPPNNAFSLASSSYPLTMKYFDWMGAGGGLSYAVAFDTAVKLADEIIKEGRVRRGYLGISAQDISSSLKIKLNIKCGVRVADVEPNSAADSAGVMKGDIIRNIDSKEVTGRASLLSLIRSKRPGELIELNIIRDGRPLELEALLSEVPESKLGGGPSSWQASLFETPKRPSANNLNHLESELARMKEEIARLQSQITDLKKEAGR
jgi:S1-C subfamily serine protease